MQKQKLIRLTTLLENENNMIALQNKLEKALNNKQACIPMTFCLSKEKTDTLEQGLTLSQLVFKLTVCLF